MGLDIRTPIGMMFTIIGLILTISGLLNWNNAAFWHSSLDININFIWGLALLVFGAGMLLFSLLGRKKD